MHPEVEEEREKIMHFFSSFCLVEVKLEQKKEEKNKKQ